MKRKSDLAFGAACLFIIVASLALNYWLRNFKGIGTYCHCGEKK